MEQEDETRYLRLCERIREHCRQRGYYAADKIGDAILARIGYSGEGFVYPPATADQVARAEHCLGYRLPPLLRLLYTELANGGFGPYLGLIGVETGHPYMYSDTLSQWLSTVTLEKLGQKSEWFFDDQITEQLAERHEDYDTYVLFPESDTALGLLSIIAVSTYAYTLALDLRTDRIYQVTPHVPVDVEGKGMIAAMAAMFVAQSVEELMEQWLTDSVNAWHWRRARDGMMCLGFVDRHGLSEIHWPELGYEGETHPSPKEDEFGPNEAMTQAEFDALMDSDDWRWYQSQPPMEAE